MTHLTRFLHSVGLSIAKGIGYGLLMALFAVLFNAVALGLAWLVGNAVLYWTRHSVPDAGEAVGLGVVSVFVLIVFGLGIAFVCNAVKELRRLWRDASLPRPCE